MSRVLLNYYVPTYSLHSDTRAHAVRHFRWCLCGLLPPRSLVVVLRPHRPPHLSWCHDSDQGCSVRRKYSRSLFGADSSLSGSTAGLVLTQVFQGFGGGIAATCSQLLAQGSVPHQRKQFPLPYTLAIGN